MLPGRVGDVDLLVETVAAAGSESTSRLQDAGGRVVDAFDHARDAIVEIASSTAEAIQRLGDRAIRPEQVEVEFGLKFSAQGNVVVAGTSGEASLVIKVMYQAAQAHPHPQPAPQPASVP
ncbi:CU044_2847 family protein [Streptomyces sp. H10-C2]|uniref:CU044_2847 family protein n=1 Tax=unclassified Streptomyces TaxID=2593676 RepID=UPI0024BBC6B2|nr:MULTISPECIES: CU044_2847 family protein [unclassified Streptomyces]MDJ0346187.1 CU044_2847 family protein [Streptomyces sp. PH10-H1]MDJ0371138.1 CU044_2847 family protein [Streptomyces sp. H10-C2]